MNGAKYMYLIAAVISTVFVGCAGRVQVSKSEPVFFDSATVPEVMQAAEEVLNRMHFVVEKFDAENGVVITRPLRAAQFFEFWRSDDVGGADNLQANIHSIQKTAKLGISRQQQKICVTCRVTVRRLSIPEKQFEGITRTSRMFTKSDDSLQSLRLNVEQARQMDFIELGSDAALERRILKLIENRLSRGTKS